MKYDAPRFEFCRVQRFPAVVVGEAAVNVISHPDIILIGLSQAFDYIYIVFQLTSPPSPRLRRAAFAPNGHSGWPASRCSHRERRLVEPRGVEPLTSTLPV